MTLILASASASRRRLLEAVGLQFEVDSPRVDEEAAKQSLRAQGVKPRDQADALAELKALSISNRRPGYVIGADQMLAIDNDTIDKARDLAEARDQLMRLRGREHHLMTAAVVARDGQVIWRHVDTPRLKMRAFSDAFLDAYLRQAGESVLSCVGAYQLEGLGGQLFERVDGDHFAVQGLPLFPLLAFLREHGIVGK